MTLEAAILSIGDEMLSGSVTDTNSAWISDFLLGRGIQTTLHLSVRDDIQKIVRAFKIASESCTVVIVSGGLGPTTDDLTTEAFCRFADVQTELNPLALAAIEDRFRAIGRLMTPNNRKQAQLPQGSVMLENPIGTAAGYYMDVAGTRYFFVPGVPRECLKMIEEQVWPAITSMQDKPGVVTTALLRTFGLTESMLDLKLADVPLPQGCRLGYRAVFPEIQVKLMVSDENEDRANATLAQLKDALNHKVGEFIFSQDGRPLEQVVGDLLIEKGLKLVTAESCTGGLIAKRLTDVAGSSGYFERGFVTYSNLAKAELLGVDPDLIDTKGAVSVEVAKAMAQGAKSRSGADIALAVTGIAGPGGGTPEKPVGTVHMTLCHQGGTIHIPFLFPRPDRSFIRELTAQAGLELLRRHLLNISMQWILNPK